MDAKDYEIIALKKQIEEMRKEKAPKYQARETPGAVWYKDDQGGKYRKDKKTGHWRIIEGNLAMFTKFLETNTNIIF